MKATNYLKLVEEYPTQYDMTQFEKVLVSARRAKDLHTEKALPLVDSEHKPPYTALEEMHAGAVHIVYREEEPESEALLEDTEESEEEE